MLTQIAALNNQTRLRIMAMLKRAPMTADHIAGRFIIKKDGILKHLSALERSGIIRRNGMLYTINPFWVEILEKLEKVCK